MGFAGFLSRTFLHAATQNPVLSCIPRCFSFWSRLASCVGASPAALEAPGALGPNPARPHAEQSLNSEYSGLQMERNGFQYIFSGDLLFYLLRSLYTYIMHICLDVIIYMSTILNLSVHRQGRGSFCSSHDRSPKSTFAPLGRGEISRARNVGPQNAVSVLSPHATLFLIFCSPRLSTPALPGSGLS